MAQQPVVGDLTEALDRPYTVLIVERYPVRKDDTLTRELEPDHTPLLVGSFGKGEAETWLTGHRFQVGHPYWVFDAGKGSDYLEFGDQLYWRSKATVVSQRPRPVPHLVTERTL